MALAGVIVCSLAPGLLFWKGAMGGGDLKLFAAIGAMCQPLIGLEAEMYAFVVAAVLAPARMAYEGRLLEVLKNSLSLFLNPLRSREKRREIPPEMMTWFRLGPAVFVGTALAHWYAL
jgi:prepilin peptidase CpaA